MPIRAGMPYVPWRGPCEATRLLRYELPRHGFHHISQSVQHGSSAPSVVTEPSVRRQDGSLIRYEESAPVRVKPALRPARQVASPQTDQHPESSREGHSPTNSVRDHTV